MSNLATYSPALFGIAREIKEILFSIVKYRTKILLLFSPSIIWAFDFFTLIKYISEKTLGRELAFSKYVIVHVIIHVISMTIRQMLIVVIYKAVIAYRRNKKELPTDINATYSKIGIASSIFAVVPLITLFLLRFDPILWWELLARPGVVVGMIGALIGFIGLIDGVSRNKKIVFAVLGILFNDLFILCIGVGGFSAPLKFGKFIVSRVFFFQ